MLPPIVSDSNLPIHQLPTLQMNALRKLLSRSEFTPHEVAALGYQRLKKAEGIGGKGLINIAAWLKAHNLEIAGSAPPPKTPKVKNLEKAQKLLESHGYIVQPSTHTQLSEKSSWPLTSTQTIDSLPLTKK